MRARSEEGGLSVHAIAGTHVVLLGLDVKGYESSGTGSKPDLSAMMSVMTLDRRGRAKDVVGPSLRTRSSSSGSKVKGGSGGAFVGFAIDRLDNASKESVSLNVDGRPVQKFHFGDYTVLPGREYVYTVRRMIKGGSTSSGSSVTVKITTEDPTKGKHGIYFNRGVAGSKAYTQKFGGFRKHHLVSKFGSQQWRPIINPRLIPDMAKSEEALAWLSRGLEEALIEFISQAKGKDHRLLATVYEFTHPETVQAFASAVERGVDVKIVRHCKGTYRARVKRNDIVKDESGEIAKDWIPDGATDAAKKAIDGIGFASLEHAHTWQHDTFIERKHSSGLMHNKFIVLVENGKPVQVWTGSVNPTDGGIYGQSNVGHIVRDEDVASQYAEYWQRLAKDIPGRKRASNSSFGGSGHDEESEPMDQLNEEQQPDLDCPFTSPAIKVIFSPRTTTEMLQWYADRMGDARSSLHYTAAFGVAQPIAEVLNEGQSGKDGGPRRSPRFVRSQKEQENAHGDSFLRYVLLDNKPSERSSEKSKSVAEKNGKDYVDYYDFKDVKENRIAFGALLSSDGEDDVSRETLTGLTTFVDYVHTKYMIVDALTDNPLVVTGSANFSMASTDKNDENSLVIQGDTSVADVYFTEYMRLFDHFYARDLYNEISGRRNSGRAWGEVAEDESWLRPYFDPSSQLYRERLLLRYHSL
ncbi:hypothetical protein ACHAXT_001119 [Thalassiosira profunda]